METLKNYASKTLSALRSAEALLKPYTTVIDVLLVVMLLLNLFA